MVTIQKPQKIATKDIDETDIPTNTQVLTFNSAKDQWDSQDAATGGTDLTTKGDLHGFDTVNDRIPVGADDLCLIADDTDGLGVIWGVLPVAGGGTGVTTSTGTTNTVLSNDPTLVAPVLGTPASGALTNCTSVPVNQGTGILPDASMPNLTGDVTTVEGAVATTIAAKAVDVAMLADGTDGELITWSATGVAAVVATGSNNEILTSNGAGTAPTFQAAAAGGDMVLADVQTVTGAKTFGSIGGAVGKFILAGSTSGSTIVNASAVAGTTTATIPAATDTLMGKATTDTMTNKTFDANGTGNSLSNVDVADLANGTDGELITWSATAVPATVAVGTATHVLTSNGVGTAPTFQAAGGGGANTQILNLGFGNITLSSTDFGYPVVGAFQAATTASINESFMVTKAFNFATVTIKITASTGDTTDCEMNEDTAQAFVISNITGSGEFTSEQTQLIDQDDTVHWKIFDADLKTWRCLGCEIIFT